MSRLEKLVFTDEDLERMRETLADREQDLDWMYTGPDGDKYSALLARLDAAERCIIPTYCDEEQTDYSDDYKDWLKSAGKPQGEERA